MNTNRILSIAALVLALAALLVAVTNPSGGRDPAPAASAGAPDTALAGQLETLRRDNQALRESCRELQNQIARLEATAAPAPAGSADLSQVRKRLDQLEATQNQWTKFQDNFDQYGVIAAMEKEVADAYVTLLDENQPAGVRIKQAEKLKRYGHFDAQAVEAMMNLYTTATGPKEKGGALQALTGLVKTPEFRDQILTDLDQDVRNGNQDPWFRYYAIEALEPMLPDPVVEEWLSHLARNDPNPKLAARAGRPLGIEPPPPVKK